MRTVPPASVPPEIRGARWLDLSEGETVSGRVVQLPTRGAFAGTRLFLRTDSGEVISIAAAARRGWTTLERGLADENVQDGDEICVEFRGWRRTVDKERQYRLVRVGVLARAPRPQLGQAA